MTNEWFNLIYRGNRSPKSGWILLPKALVTTAGGKQYPMIYQNSDCLITKQFNVVPICSCKRHSTRLFSVSSNYGLKTSGKELRTPWKMGANWRLRYQGYDRYYITQYTMLLLLPSIGKKEIYKRKYLMPSHHFLGQQSWAHVQSPAAADKLQTKRMDGDNNPQTTKPLFLRHIYSDRMACEGYGELADKISSQKIIWSLSCSIRLNLSRGRVKLKKILLHVLPNLKNGSHIPTSVAVVWCTKYSYHILVLKD